MVSSLSCLSEEALWAVVTSSPEDQRHPATAHLEDCSVCQKRSERLRSSFDEIYRYVDVNEFLNQEEQTEGTTENVAGTCLDTDLPMEGRLESIADPLLVGQILISKYRVIRLLNSGGQGHVYLAEDLQLNRHVAIKVARFSIDENVVSAETIVSEGEMLAKVNHPRVTHVYDCGVHAGRPYLVMEYVEGCSLKEYLCSHALASGKIHKLITDIALAVKALHAHGILHLDLKPENIMVTRDERCKLIDLGAAWFQPAVTLSSETIVGGTLDYMAPEQATGTVSAYSERTDVFGLGAVLFAFLHGQPPGAEFSETLSTPHRLPGTSQSERQSKFDKELQKICFKSLSPDPEHRYSSAEELLDALESLANRRRAPVIICCGLAFCLVGFLSMLSQRVPDWFSSRPVQERIGDQSPRATHVVSQSLMKYIQVRVKEAPGKSIQFCLWSQQNGVLFLPAFRVSEKEADHELKGGLQGFELSSRNDFFAVLAIDSAFQDGTGDQDLSRDLDRELRKISTQQTSIQNAGIVQAAGAISAGHQIIPISHHNFPTKFPAISGVLVHAMAQQTTATHYNLELSFNMSEPPVCKIRSE